MIELSKQDLLYGQKTGKLDSLSIVFMVNSVRVKFIVTIHHTEGIVYYVYSGIQGPSPIMLKDRA